MPVEKYPNEAETVLVFCFSFISGCANIWNKNWNKIVLFRFYFTICDGL